MSLFNKLLNIQKQDESRKEDKSNTGSMIKTKKKKKSIGTSGSESSVNTTSDDEDNDQYFQLYMLEEYKQDLMRKQKKVFTPNFEYKAKMHAINALQKETQKSSADRPCFIINIEHSFLSEERVIFTIKTVVLKGSKILFKSQEKNVQTYTSQLEVHVDEKSIRDVVQEFCQDKNNLIHITDEISLTNYVFQIVEAQRIALESKKLILEIQNFKTDNLLKQFNDKGEFEVNEAQVRKIKKLRPNEKVTMPSEDWERKFMAFWNFVDRKKEHLVARIYKKLKYRGIPYRIYERNEIYEVIKNKLYSNLHYSVDLALYEGVRIIKHYKDLDFYLLNFAFDMKKQYKQKNKRKHHTVDMLLKKQKEVKKPLDFSRQMRPSSLFDQSYNKPFDYKSHRFTMSKETSPLKRDTTKNVGQYTTTDQQRRSNTYAKPSQLFTSLHMDNNSTLQNNNRLFSNRPSATYDNLDQTAIRNRQVRENEKQNHQDSFKIIQSREVNRIDAIIRQQCEESD